MPDRWLDGWPAGEAGGEEVVGGQSRAGTCSWLKSFGREARKCIRAQFSLGGESNQELAVTLESFR